MSHSPTSQNQDLQETKEYLEGWSATYELVRQGKSWSGNERHVCLLNTTDGSFTDISSVSGLDLPEDGRGLAVVDWDRDGALDLVFSNRTAPQVRVFHNRTAAGGPDHRYLALRLQGQTTNRDGIGARVTLWVEGEKEPRIKTLRAGSGYLSQSSKWLHFGLGSASTIREVSVRWPGGDSESFSGAGEGGWYLLVEGSGRAEPWTPPSSPNLEARPVELPEATQAGRILLAPRLPVSGLRYQPSITSSDPEPVVTSGDGALLINLWATWCGNCRHELQELAATKRKLGKNGLRILALSVDEPADHAAAFRFLDDLDWPFESGLAPASLLDVLEILRQTVLDQPEGLVLPTSFLIDRDSRLAAIYRGPVAVDQLVSDLTRLDDPKVTDRDRASRFPGRWYGNEPGRDLELLANLMRSRGFLDLAAFYLEQIPATTDRPEWDRSNKTQSSIELGRALLADGKPKEALAVLQRGLAIDPDQPRLLVELATAYEASGNLIETTRHLRRAVELDPSYAFAHFRLGMVLVQTTAADEGHASLEQALATSQESDEVHALALFNLGVHYGEQREEPAEAEDYVRRSLALKPKHLEAWRYLGVLQQRRGDLEDAVASFQEALEIEPADGQSLYYLGQTYFALGDRAGLEQQVQLLGQLGSPLTANLERLLVQLPAP